MAKSLTTLRSKYEKWRVNIEDWIRAVSSKRVGIDRFGNVANEKKHPTIHDFNTRVRSSDVRIHSLITRQTEHRTSSDKHETRERNMQLISSISPMRRQNSLVGRGSYIR